MVIQLVRILLHQHISNHLPSKRIYRHRPHFCSKPRRSISKMKIKTRTSKTTQLPFCSSLMAMVMVMVMAMVMVIRNLANNPACILQNNPIPDLCR